MTLHRITIAATLVSLSLLASNAIANLWEERQALYAVSKELLAIESLVLDAEKKSIAGSRTAFKYNAVLDDLRLIRNGIDHHLSQPIEPVDPSDIKQLDPAYTDHKL
tara:strand:+ start:37019 stop:37339 length:321 start_codon:yes stop_codon:yes gene_type:complete